MSLLVGLPESSCAQVFPSLHHHHHHGSPHSHITWGLKKGPLVAAVLRRKSYTIDMINQSMIKVRCIPSFSAGSPIYLFPIAVFLMSLK
jgi:hypothetical protein